MVTVTFVTTKFTVPLKQGRVAFLDVSLFSCRVIRTYWDEEIWR